MKLPLTLTTKQLQIAGIVALVLFALYYVVVMRPSLPYAYYVLAKYRFQGMEADYIKAWARAHEAGEPSFQYQNKNYLTSTGLAQK